MNAKFFVPFETAKQLQVKGFNEKVNGYYTNRGELAYCQCPIDNEEQVNRYGDISAPTYHEVLDWLESKFMYITTEISYSWQYQRMVYCCTIITPQKHDCTDDYYNREEALNAAILKVLEMI